MDSNSSSTFDLRLASREWLKKPHTFGQDLVNGKPKNEIQKSVELGCWISWQIALTSESPNFDAVFSKMKHHFSKSLRNLYINI